EVGEKEGRGGWLGAVWVTRRGGDPEPGENLRTQAMTGGERWPLEQGSPCQPAERHGRSSGIRSARSNVLPRRGRRTAAKSCRYFAECPAKTMQFACSIGRAKRGRAKPRKIR